MTQQKRLHRAEELFLHYVICETSPAEAWRLANPNSKCNDTSAAAQTRRELGWYEQHIEPPNRENGFEELLRCGDPIDSITSEPGHRPKSNSGASAAKPGKTCIGVAGRPCGREIPARRKRCQDCQAENRRLQKQGHDQAYFKDNRERLNAKRRERRRKQRQCAVVDAVATLIRNELKRQATLPRLIAKPGERPYLLDPLTGKKDFL